MGVRDGESGNRQWLRPERGNERCVARDKNRSVGVGVRKAVDLHLLQLHRYIYIPAPLSYLRNRAVTSLEDELFAKR